METNGRCALRSGARGPASDLCKHGHNMAYRFEKVNVNPTVPHSSGPA